MIPERRWHLPPFRGVVLGGLTQGLGAPWCGPDGPSVPGGPSQAGRRGGPSAWRVRGSACGVHGEVGKGRSRVGSSASRKFLKALANPPPTAYPVPGPSSKFTVVFPLVPSAHGPDGQGEAAELPSPPPNQSCRAFPHGPRWGQELWLPDCGRPAGRARWGSNYLRMKATKERRPSPQGHPHPQQGFPNTPGAFELPVSDPPLWGRLGRGILEDMGGWVLDTELQLALPKQEGCVEYPSSQSCHTSTPKLGQEGGVGLCTMAGTP